MTPSVALRARNSDCANTRSVYNFTLALSRALFANRIAKAICFRNTPKGRLPLPPPPYSRPNAFRGDHGNRRSPNRQPDSSRGPSQRANRQAHRHFASHRRRGFDFAGRPRRGRELQSGLAGDRNARQPCGRSARGKSGGRSSRGRHETYGHGTRSSGVGRRTRTRQGRAARAPSSVSEARLCRRRSEISSPPQSSR